MVAKAELGERAAAVAHGSALNSIPATHSVANGGDDWGART